MIIRRTERWVAAGLGVMLLAGGGACGNNPSATASAGSTGATSSGAGGGAACSIEGIWVSPDGQGDACSCDAPCALETGRDHARALAAGASGDILVMLLGGTYRLTKTFTLGATDAGQNGHVIIYRAAPGEAPTLSGAVAVSGFAPWPQGPGTWVASVPQGTHARQLWVNGRRATRARGPDAPAGFTMTPTGFTLGDPAMASWPDRGGIEVVGTTAWKMFRCPVSGVAAAGVTIAEPCWGFSQAQAGYTFNTVAWIENARELLDEGGEFYLDDAMGSLYYRPRDGEDMQKADVELPVLEELVHGEGTPAAPLHDVTFDGITFAYATWTRPSTNDGYASLQAGITPTGSPAVQQKPLANVTFHAAHNIHLLGCRFTHLGGAALAFEVGAQDNLVSASRFEDISASAVMIGDVTHEDDHHPKDPALIVANNVVEKSYITRAGAEYFDTTGIFVGYTTHTSLLNNDLFDLPYTGISVGWGWGGVDVGGPGGYNTPSTSHDAEIRHNRISHHMRRLHDGGAIYVLGAQSGATMADNVVDNQANPYGNLYLDNGTQGYTVANNVVLLSPKTEIPNDPDRTYWLYVQVYDPVAKNNQVGVNFTNDPTPFTPKPIDPSNMLTAPTVLGGGPSGADAILAAAGSPLRSPNIAAGKPATASSEYDPGHTAALASDDNAFDGWSPAGNDMSASWQVDLGGSYAIDAIEVVSRWSLDQPVTRRAYRVLASADPAFKASAVLGAVDRTGLPHRAIFAVDVSPPVVARYVRVEKTDPEYFFLGDVRVHGRPAM